MKSAIRLTSVLIAIAFCAPAFAGGSDKPQVNLAKAQKSKKVCFVMTSASGIPIPCERIRGIPTTGGPMDVIGNKSPN